MGATFVHGTSRENDPQLHVHSAIFNLAKTPLEGKSGSALSGALVSISTGARLGLSVQHGPGPDAWNKFVHPQLRESGSAPLPDAAAAAASRLWLPSVVIGQSNSRRDRHEERGNDVIMTPSKRGRKPAERNPLSAKVHELEAKVARLEKELHTAHTILDVQGKVAGLLGFSLEHGKDC